MKKIKAKLQEPGLFKDKLIEYFDRIIDEVSRVEEQLTKNLGDKLRNINLSELEKQFMKEVESDEQKTSVLAG